jgi:hypothetical protein
MVFVGAQRNPAKGRELAKNGHDSTGCRVSNELMPFLWFIGARKLLGVAGSLLGAKGPVLRTGALLPGRDGSPATTRLLSTAWLLFQSQDVASSSTA